MLEPENKPLSFGSKEIDHIQHDSDSLDDGSRIPGRDSA